MEYEDRQSPAAPHAHSSAAEYGGHPGVFEYGAQQPVQNVSSTSTRRQTVSSMFELAAPVAGSSGDRPTWRRNTVTSGMPPHAIAHRAHNDYTSSHRQPADRGSSGDLQLDGHNAATRQGYGGVVDTSQPQQQDFTPVYPEITRKKVEMACHFCRSEILPLFHAYRNQRTSFT